MIGSRSPVGKPGRYAVLIPSLNSSSGWRAGQTSSSWQSATRWARANVKPVYRCVVARVNGAGELVGAFERVYQEPPSYTRWHATSAARAVAESWLREASGEGNSDAGK